MAGLDQLSQTSGVVVAIISSPRGARASIDVDKRGKELRALGIGVGMSTALVSKGNLMDSVSLLELLIDFSEV